MPNYQLDNVSFQTIFPQKKSLSTFPRAKYCCIATNSLFGCRNYMHHLLFYNHHCKFMKKLPQYMYMTVSIKGLHRKLPN